MSASSRTVQATPGIGQLVAVFAALLAGTALIVALAYGQLTASQGSLAPAAAPAPASAHDHGSSSSPEGAVPAARDSGWIDTTPVRPVVRGTGFDKSHHAVKRRFELVEERGFGSNRVPFAK
jgi:hypothetical protein